MQRFKMAPLVSIIMPVFNGASFLHEAVQSCVKQAHTPIEIVAVNDGSTDDSASILEGLPVRLLNHPRQLGIAAATNTGVRNARGQFITFLDQDDVMASQAIQQRLRWLETHPNSQVVGGTIAGPIESLGNTPDNAAFSALGPLSRGKLTLQDFDEGEYFVGLWAYMFRRSFIESLGPLDERLRIAADREFVYRTLSRADIPLIDCATIYKRIHTNNASVKKIDGALVMSSQGYAETYLVNVQYGVKKREQQLNR